MENVKQLLSVNELSKMTGLSKKFIYGLVQERKVAYLESGRKFLVSYDSLQAFISSNLKEVEQ